MVSREYFCLIFDFVRFIRVQILLLIISNMEDPVKTFSTQSKTKISGWLDNESPENVNTLQGSVSPSILSSDAEAPSNSPQYCKISSMVSALITGLDQLKQQHKIAKENSEGDQLNQQQISSYGSLSALCLDLEKNAKETINDSFGKLDAEIVEVKRNQAAAMKKNQQEMRVEVEEINRIKKKCIDDARQLHSKAYDQVTQKIRALKKASTEFCRSNEGFRGEIFAKLALVRGKFVQEVDEEEKRRKTYNQIIFNLMEKSSEKAQQSLRRRL